MKLKPISQGVLGLGLSFALLEVLLRLTLGLGNPPLSQTDDKMGYRFQPNQKLFRFGKYIEYNQFSQRNSPISEAKPAGTTRILMIGDSVINGGVVIDQSRTLPELFRAKLGNPSEVLNASAGSWGIENRIGYLQKFGTFQSDAIIFQIGTSDLIQPTSSSSVVGVSPQYPDHRPWSAISEGWTRYVLPLFGGWVQSALMPPAYAQPQLSPQEKAAWFARNMQSFRQEIQAFRKNPKTKQIPIVVLYTPDRADVLPQSQEPLYKAEFFHLLKSLNIPVVDVHTAWSTVAAETIRTYFFDDIHLTEAGNQAVADLMFEQFCRPSHSTWCKP
ncbi:MAG: SGNH/GDSL hydrolase family protein [Leptolyngbya sp. Prado105]|jgi:lysophospholipase L1-like esterase|nr:SGNH/GDSL hydrolase family protein [Leptolyngbya sp. Prado105]